MTDTMLLNEHDLVENPTTRLPVVLCLDTSSSMSGQPITELNRGVELFFEAIKQDEIARYSVEIAIVTFDSDVECKLDFASIDRQEVPYVYASGATSMGEGVIRSLQMLQSRKEEYSSVGVDYYQPWLVLMSDGYPTDDVSEAIEQVERLKSERKLTLFPVAIGENADLGTLKNFSTLGNSMVLKVKSAEYFREFFEWLSQSVSIASQSIPGERSALPATPPSIEIEL